MTISVTAGFDPITASISGGVFHGLSVGWRFFDSVFDGKPVALSRNEVEMRRGRRVQVEASRLCLGADEKRACFGWL